MMVNPIDFGGHSSNVKVTMGIIDKFGVRGDATLCVVIFFDVLHPIPNYQLEFQLVSTFVLICLQRWSVKVGL